MIAIIDYDAGNIKSVEKALAYLGEEVRITRDREEILASDGVILPGVGAFGDAMEKLHTYGLVDVIREVVRRQIPFLGICLGLQLMFESSEETPGVEGLHLLDGTIHRIPAAPGLKIPHIGWNDLTFQIRADFSGALKNIRMCILYTHFIWRPLIPLSLRRRRNMEHGFMHLWKKITFLPVSSIRRKALGSVLKFCRIL